MHLDGYDQTDVITGKGPSKRHEIFYFTEGIANSKLSNALTEKKLGVNVTARNWNTVNALLKMGEEIGR